MDHHSMTQVEAAIPTKGVTYHTEVDSVERARNAFEGVRSCENLLRAGYDFRCYVTTSEPLQVGAAYDVTIKPAPSE